MWLFHIINAHKYECYIVLQRKNSRTCTQDMHNLPIKGRFPYSNRRMVIAQKVDRTYLKLTLSEDKYP